MSPALIVLMAGGVHVGVGVVFGLMFVTAGVGRIDPAARGAPWSFRLLLLPGAIVLWPVLLAKWGKASIHPEHHQ